MIKIIKRGAVIRKFILQNVEKHPSTISMLTAKNFGITRQAVNKHLIKLRKEGALTESGNTKSRIYKLTSALFSKTTYKINNDLAEDIIWRNDVKPALINLPENVLGIWEHGFTEMFNNVIDHSEGSKVQIEIIKTPINTTLLIRDNGIGIFKKIQRALDLSDERQAILELVKGKLTTDPKRHSGEGIFFTSRIFDYYRIFSGELIFSHEFGDPEDWIIEKENLAEGTTVLMRLDNNTTRTAKKYLISLLLMKIMLLIRQLSQ